MNTYVQAWLRQPTTVTGIAALIATAAGAVAQYLTGQATFAASAGGIAFAVTHLAMNDNSAAPSSVQKLVVDAVTAATQKHIVAALPQLVVDGLAAAQAISVTGVASTPTATEAAAANEPAPRAS
ncbi:MAG: hypothetical protein ACHQIO_20355 [Nevskiales bacterium]